MGCEDAESAVQRAGRGGAGRVQCNTSRPPGSGIRPSPSVDVSLAMACVSLAWLSRLSCGHGPQLDASSRLARRTVHGFMCPNATGPLSSVLTVSSVGQVLTVLQPEISSWSSSKPAASWLGSGYGGPGLG